MLYTRSTRILAESIRFPRTWSAFRVEVCSRESIFRCPLLGQLPLFYFLVFTILTVCLATHSHPSSHPIMQQRNHETRSRQITFEPNLQAAHAGILYSATVSIPWLLSAAISQQGVLDLVLIVYPASLLAAVVPSSLFGAARESNFIRSTGRREPILRRTETPCVSSSPAVRKVRVGGLSETYLRRPAVFLTTFFSSAHLSWRGKHMVSTLRGPCARSRCNGWRLGATSTNIIAGVM